MSDMHFREPNQVKWQGSRPGHNGTQVALHYGTAVAGEVLFYTVPAGVTFFLTYASMGLADDVAGVIMMSIEDLTPARWFTPIYAYTSIANNLIIPPSNFWPPLEVPTGFTFYSFTVGASFRVSNIHGWVE